MGWYSEPQDWLGQGTVRVLSPRNSHWTVESTINRERVDIVVHGPSATEHSWWHVRFNAPWGEALESGRTYEARRPAFGGPVAGLSISSDHRACNMVTGRFVIHDITYDDEDRLVSLAADVEQHCEAATPAVFVAIRYNSAFPGALPFGGDVPRYRVEVTPPVHGRVLGAALDCGPSAHACERDVPPGWFALRAIPDPGYIFTGWTGACRGIEATWVLVTSVKRCGATFEPRHIVAPRTIMRIEPAPGHYVSQGQGEVYSSANSRISISEVQSGMVSLVASGMGDLDAARWTLTIYPGQGGQFQAGRTYVAPQFGGSTAPAISYSGAGRGCNGRGQFTIRDLERDSAGQIVRMAIEFEYYCAGGTNTPHIPLYGSVQYNSLEVGLRLTLNRAALSFKATSQNGFVAAVTPAELLRLEFSRDEPVSWSVHAPSWLTVTPSSGTGPAVLSVAVPAGGSTQTGVLNGMLTVVAAEGTPAPARVAVQLVVVPAGTSVPPWGSVDTPLDGLAGLTGSIAVTGWALDDIAVARVRILRSVHQGSCNLHDPGSLVFIGDATMVEGARPDVAAAHPAAPRNTRAGWGYLLLTNFLPAMGNGTFTLCVVADDAEGHSTLLGTRTIGVDNANATKPFGAIDTPGQGETVSGLVNNFGWVLGRGARRADPPGGGTVTVFVNGAAVGSPFGWTSRADLTALFPPDVYQGVGTALGVFPLDTTTLGDGLHTIAWSVVDSQGNAEGIGSRYFTVVSGVGGALLVAAGEQAIRSSGDRRGLSSQDATGVLLARRGFDLEAPFRPVAGVVLDGEELDRFEVRLPAGVTTGALRVGGDLAPLPIGSHLDPATGTFTWQPGVGFIGAYDFVFGAHDLRIVLHPKGSNRVGPQVVIDTPFDSAPGLAQGRPRELPAFEPFLIAGWALDLDDPIGTGVDTVHVWAYPIDPTTGTRHAPWFLGAAAYGGARPDVAAVSGDRYLRSGYGLSVDTLEPGTYDLAVFAWSTVRNAFVPAQVVRVTVW